MAATVKGFAKRSKKLFIEKIQCFLFPEWTNLKDWKLLLFRVTCYKVELLSQSFAPLNITIKVKYNIHGFFGYESIRLPCSERPNFLQWLWY